MPSVKPAMNHSELAKAAGLEWFDYQEKIFSEVKDLPNPLRVCLYYRTGAGKSLTALTVMFLAGFSHALVIAPPATHEAWHREATKLGMYVGTISHAKFRQQKYKVSRKLPIIADEFHLFGGQDGMGWRKFDRVARSLLAPIVIASATPNYNDAERCYCIQSVLDPHSVKGGYIQFLYQNCQTKQNPFGRTPLVEGFLHYPDAASYLAALPGVYYVPDNTSVVPMDMFFAEPLPTEFDEYGIDASKQRVMASIIETSQRREFLWRVQDGKIHPGAMKVLLQTIKESKKVLVFAARATIAKILAEELGSEYNVRTLLVTGRTSKKRKAAAIRDFIDDPNMEVLVGTASIATGVDGLDKVCDTLVLFDDTNDASLRRQIIGRILPRGVASDESMKTVFRYSFY